MAIKTGEIATSYLRLGLDYSCSKCGQPNSTECVIKGTAQTGTAFGMNTDPNYAAKANQKAYGILGSLNDPDVTKRYNKAKLKCRCAHCGHKEPWTKLDLYPLLFTAIVWGLFTGLGMMATVSGGSKPLYLLIMAAIVIVPVALLLTIYAVVKHSILKKVKALPPQSHPRITLLPPDSTKLPYKHRTYPNFPEATEISRKRASRREGWMYLAYPWLFMNLGICIMVFGGKSETPVRAVLFAIASVALNILSLIHLHRDYHKVTEKKIAKSIARTIKRREEAEAARWRCTSFEYVSPAEVGKCMTCGTKDVPRNTFAIKNYMGFRQIPICAECAGKFQSSLVQKKE